VPVKVRLTDAEEWPRHHRWANRATLENWPHYRGKEITLGPPIDTSDHWTCDTDKVWPVLEIEDVRLSVEPIGGSERYKTYVCRHQIQAGD